MNEAINIYCYKCNAEIGTTLDEGTREKRASALDIHNAIYHPQEPQPVEDCTKELSNE